jgi:hypothetical protein
MGGHLFKQTPFLYSAIFYNFTALNPKTPYMLSVSKKSLLVFPVLLCLFSCQKEASFEIPNGANPGGGNNNGGNNNGSCNNTVMKIKKCQATFDPNHYVEASWNTDGTIHSIKINVPLTEYRTATFIYGNGKIKEAVLTDNANNNQVIDTVVFRYNTAGKVDSMYMKNDDWFDIKLDYNNGKLVKYTRYASGGVLFYWNIVTDGNDNITKAEEYYSNNTGGFDKESTYTYTRDDRKNPFAGLAQFMMYLDDDYGIFRYWGANNYTEQRYQDHTGTGIDLTTGFKFKYNNSCYPASSQQTIQGQPLFPDDDFTFTYY